MKVGFFSWLSKSNINASIPLIKALCEKKCEIYYFGYEKYRNDIEKLGIKFIAYKDKLQLGIDEINYENSIEIDDKELIDKIELKSSEELAMEYMSSYKRTIEMYLQYEDEIIDVVKSLNLDLIIKDNSAQHGKIIGHRLKVRTIAFSPMMIIDKNYLMRDIRNLFFHYDLNRVKSFSDNQLIDAYNKFEIYAYKFCEMNDLPYITPIEPQNGEDELSLVYGGNPLNIKIDDNRVIFIKPPLNEVEYSNNNILDEELENFINDEKPLIYIASGTMITADNSYYSNFVRALWDKNFNVLMSIPNIYNYNKNIPPNFLIRPFVRQQLVLKKAELFITFGGYNSICEAIENSVPMIVYPQMNDQFINAKRVNELGIGIDISKIILNPKNISKSIEEIIKNPKYKEKIKLVKNKFNQLQSIDEALNNIIY